MKAVVFFIISHFFNLFACYFNLGNGCPGRTPCKFFSMPASFSPFLVSSVCYISDKRMCRIHVKILIFLFQQNPTNQVTLAKVVQILDVML